MKHVFAIVLFAIVAGLVAVGVASEKGIRGLPQTVRQTLGLPEGGAVVANFQSVGIEGADVKAKVAKVAAEAKAKVAEVAEKAIEAAQPDRSQSVTPQPDVQSAETAEPQPEAAPEPAPEQAEAPEAAPQEPSASAEAPSTEAPPAEEAPPPATADGVTHFYGSSDGTAVAAWAGAATMNPDYEPADATGNAPVAPVATEAPAEPAPAGPADEPAVAAAPAAEPDAPAPAAEAQAEPDAAPAPTGGDGVTSYYGLASKPDADQAWAAAAAPNPDYAPGADTAEAPVSESAASEPAAAEAPAAPVEPQAAATEETAPAPTGGDGLTSYFGLANMPDADQPWAAAAAPNPDYTPGESAAPAAVAAATEPAAEEPPGAAAEPAAAPTEELPPAPLGEKGVSSYYGVAEKADATQPWAAAAAANPDYTAVVASPPEVTPATQEAVEACRDALNSEAQTGGLKFAIQRWDVTPENYGPLDKIASLAKDCGGVVIEVRGHTDNTGRPKSNQTLSDLRAKAVIQYLTKAGVPLSKLKAVGLGEDKPVGDNATVKGRAQNRRIEFVVTGG